MSEPNTKAEMKPEMVLGKPVEYWLNLENRIQELGFDKATAIEDLLLTNMALSRKLRECRNIIKIIETFSIEISQASFSLDQVTRNGNDRTSAN